MANQDHKITLSALKITLIYLVVAATWVAFTDHILSAFVSNPDYLSTLQTYKGWFYVFLTSVGLLYLIKRHDQQLASKEKEIADLSERVFLEKELTDILFERIPVMINKYNPNLNEFRINKEFEKISGWTNDEIQDIDFVKACFPDESLRQEVKDFMEQPGMGWKEVSMTLKSGKKIPTTWTNVKLTDNTLVGIGIDMTDIKKSQARIRESRQLLRKVFESLEESVLLLEPENWTIVDCNQSTEQIFGYKPSELIGKSTKVLHINESTYHKFNEMGKEALSEKGKFQAEFSMQRSSGEVFHSYHSVNLVYNKEGAVDKIVSTIQDINDQKEYQQKLEIQNNFISTTLQNLPIGVAVSIISSGETSYINDKFSEIYGWPKETLQNVDTAFELLYRDEERRAQIKEEVEADIKSGDPSRMNWKGVPIYTQKGTQKYVNTKVIPLYEQDLMISTVIDVTEQKELEKQLRQSEEKYRNIFKSNPEPMWIFNPETLAFVEVNEAAIQHYGYSEEEFLSMTLEDIRPPEDIKAMKKDVQEHRGVTTYAEDWIHLTKDGNRINVEISASDINYDNQQFRLVLINDVTERREMQEKVIQSVIEGEDRERKRIARELHDGLGQYLVAANMNFQSLKADIKGLPDKRIQQFNTGLSHLNKALSETRTIAHNLMPKAIADYGLIAALDNLVEDLKASTSINFEFHYNQEEFNLSGQAKINIYRITQEILSNAVRHSQCENIFISLKQRDHSLQLTIKDDGIGVELTEEHDQKGLGLNSIRTRVNSLNGSLDIDSQPGEGMETTVIFPNIDKLIANSKS